LKLCKTYSDIQVHR